MRLQEKLIIESFILLVITLALSCTYSAFAQCPPGYIHCGSYPSWCCSSLQFCVDPTPPDCEQVSVTSSSTSSIPQSTTTSSIEITSSSSSTSTSILTTTIISTSSSSSSSTTTSNITTTIVSTTTTTLSECTIRIEPDYSVFSWDHDDPITLTAITEGNCTEPHDYEWTLFYWRDIGGTLIGDRNSAFITYGSTTNNGGIPHRSRVTVIDHTNNVSADAIILVMSKNADFLVDFCLVTSVYGEHSEEVNLLRTYRDEALSKTPTGQEIIRLYYQWSPIIIMAMEEDEDFKQEVRELINEMLPMIEEAVE